jgi:hypothetical protein
VGHFCCLSTLAECPPRSHFRSRYFARTGWRYVKLLWRFNLKKFRNFLKRSRRSHVIPLNRCILRGEGTWSRHFYFIFNFELSTKFYCLEKRPISFCICSCQNVNTERKLHDASGSPLKMI